MRLLWVKGGRLLPVDTGGKLRSYNLLKVLADRHELTLLTYYDGARDVDYEQAMTKEFPGSVTLTTGYMTDSTVRSAVHYARRVTFAAPYAVSKFTVPAVRTRVEQWMNEARFDVAVCDFLSASLNFPRVMPTPSVLFQHNVESALWRRQATFERNRMKRLVFAMEAAKMARYEPAAVARFDHVIAVSESDRALMKSMTDASRITVVPTGVDLKAFRSARAPTGNEQPIVLFLGSMDWEANIDGAEWFCEQVWPRVLAAVPEARFRIVGRNPHARVKRLAGDSVDVTGSVPSIVDYVRDAAVFVVPLRIGGGTRLKIFEGMAMGKAVVSTTVGAEGLDVTHGKDIVLADEAPPFAAAIVRFIADPSERRRFGDAAMALAERFDWATVGEEFASVLQETARRAALDSAPTRSRRTA
jgi:glycosyltransferase involved in cell wall biosynthesis